jgi:hypothetical protein
MFGYWCDCSSKGKNVGGRRAQEAELLRGRNTNDAHNVSYEGCVLKDTKGKGGRGIRVKRGRKWKERKRRKIDVSSWM